MQSFDSCTPLHHTLTTEFEREEKVHALLETRAGVTMRDYAGQAPVDVVWERDANLFEFLLRVWRDQGRAGHQ